MFALILLLAAGSCVYSIDLIQPDSTVVQPAQSLTITCQVSGYSMTDDTYGTGWIRKREGKAMDWISHQWGTSGLRQNNALKNNFSYSRDTSARTATITGQNLQTEDTAVYYCVRIRMGNYFDYWGKGTTVTVTTATSTAPTVFPLVPCGSESGDMVTLGCLATGFNPPAVTFSWTKGGAALTDFIQYPAVQKGDVYTGVSQVRVRTQDWNPQENFQCAVTHAAGNAQAPITKPQVFEQNPTLKVLSSFIEDGTYTVSCFAKEFAPKKHEIKWLKNRADITSKIDMTSTVSESTKADGKKVYSVASFLTVNSSEVNEDTEFTCVFTGGQSASLNKTDRDNTLDVSTTVDLTNGPIVTVHILPQLPTASQAEITLVCLVTSAVNKMYKIEWSEKYGNKPYATGTDFPAKQSKNDKKWRSMSLYTTSKANWDKPKMFTCLVQSEKIHKSVSSAICNSKEIPNEIQDYN